MSEIKRIGVLTGGGDCSGLNAVVRAVTLTAINKYGCEVIGFKRAMPDCMPTTTCSLRLKTLRRF